MGGGGQARPAQRGCRRSPERTRRRGPGCGGHDHVDLERFRVPVERQCLGVAGLGREPVRVPDPHQPRRPHLRPAPRDRRPRADRAQTRQRRRRLASQQGLPPRVPPTGLGASWRRTSPARRRPRRSRSTTRDECWLLRRRHRREPRVHPARRRPTGWTSPGRRRGRPSTSCSGSTGTGSRWASQRMPRGCRTATCSTPGSGRFTLLRLPVAATSVVATGINDHGQVVGFYQIGKITDGFVWGSGHLTVLHYGNRTDTQALGVNNLGAVVGSFVDAGGRTHGFVRSAAGWIRGWSMRRARRARWSTGEQPRADRGVLHGPAQGHLGLPRSPVTGMGRVNGVG